MDSSASNYSANAEEDDGSCVFPTTAEMLVGTWKGTQAFTTIAEGDTSKSTQDISITFSADGTGFNPEGDPSEADGSSDSFTWTAVDNTITIVEGDGHTLIFTATTNTATNQVWETSTTRIRDGKTVTVDIVSTMSK